MGYSISWVAISGEEPERALEKLGLARTGEFEEVAESYLTSPTLPSPWLLIRINRFDAPFISWRVLASLSVNWSVTACQVEEHVMFSSASSYANGSLVWRVKHDAQQGIKHLSSTGSTPPQLGEIHDRLMDKQDAAGGINARVDYIFDVPVALAQSITSYRHDSRSWSESEKPYEVLRQEYGTTHEAKPRIRQKGGGWRRAQ